jgi:hypothetical protein
VIGAGPIGLFCQQALQVLRGSRVYVADLSPERLAVAKKLGAVRVINPREEDVVKIMLAETGGEGADLTVDAVGGSITKKTSLEALRPGGASVWIGLHENTVTLDTYGITLPEKQVLGTYAAPSRGAAAGARPDGHRQGGRAFLGAVGFPLEDGRHGLPADARRQGRGSQGCALPMRLLSGNAGGALGPVIPGAPANRGVKPLLQSGTPSCHDQPPHSHSHRRTFLRARSPS